MPPTPPPSNAAAPSPPPAASFSSLPYELRSDIARRAFPTLGDQCRGMLVCRDFFALVAAQPPFADLATDRSRGLRGNNVRAMARYMATLPPPARSALVRLWHKEPAHDALASLNRVRAPHRKALVQHDPRLWLALPRAERGNRALAAAAVGRVPDVYRLLPAALREDPSLAAAAVACSPEALRWLPTSLHEDRSVQLACVPHLPFNGLSARSAHAGTEPPHPVLRAASHRLGHDLAFACDAVRPNPRVMSLVGGAHFEATELCLAYLSRPGRLLPVRREGGPYATELLPEALASHPGNLFSFPQPAWWLGERFAASIHSGVRPPRGTRDWLEFVSSRPPLAADMVARWPDVFAELPASLQNDIDVARAFVSRGGTLEAQLAVRQALFDDVALARQVARMLPARMDGFSEACLTDRTVILNRIRHSLTYPVSHFRHLYVDDAELMLAAARRDADELTWASTRLLSDPTFVLDALSAHQSNGWFQCVDSGLRDNRTFMLAAIELDFQSFAWASPRLQQDDDFFRHAVEHDGCVFAFNTDPARFGDRDLFRAALRSASQSMRVDSGMLDFKANEAFALAAIHNSAFNFLRLPLELKSNRTVMEAALRKEGALFSQLPYPFRDDALLFLLGVANSHENLLPFASARLRRSDSILRIAFPSSAHVFAQAVAFRFQMPTPTLVDAYLRIYPQALYALTRAQSQSAETRVLASLTFSQMAAAFPQTITCTTVPAAFPASMSVQMRRLYPELSVAEG